MRQDAQANKLAIMRTARAMISRGDQGISMRAIAREAEVGIATLSRHFPDRASLIFAIMDDALSDLAKVIDNHLSGLNKNPKEEWPLTAHAIAKLGLPSLAEGLFTLVDISAVDLEKVHVRARRDRLVELCEKLLEPVKDAALVPQDLDPTQFYLGLAAASRPLSPLAEILVPGLHRWTVDTYLDGVRAQATKQASQ